MNIDLPLEKLDPRTWFKAKPSPDEHPDANPIEAGAASEHPAIPGTTPPIYMTDEAKTYLESLGFQVPPVIQTASPGTPKTLNTLKTPETSSATPAQAEETLAMATTPINPATADTPTSAPAQPHQGFLSRLAHIGQVVVKDFEKALGLAVQYELPVTALVGVLFPGFAPESAALGNAVQLLQKGVLAVEMQFAASGKALGTGAQKSAELLSLAGPAVTAFLAQEKIKADTPYIQKLIDATVSILNVPQPAAVV